MKWTASCGERKQKNSFFILPSFRLYLKEFKIFLLNITKTQKLFIENTRYVLAQKSRTNQKAKQSTFVNFS